MQKKNSLILNKETRHIGDEINVFSFNMQSHRSLFFSRFVLVENGKKLFVVELFHW